VNPKPAWKLRVSTQSFILIIAVCVSLLVPAILQYRIVRQKRLRAKAVERESRLVMVRNEAESRRIWLEQQTSKVNDANRVHQLYHEINGLMRASERLQQWGSSTAIPPAQDGRVRQD
jgi:hypothetical protein